MSLISPGLWIVGTPIGNPGDLSPRARQVLEGVDLILAEDTKRAGLAFKRWGLESRRFLSCHEHNEAGRVDMLINLIREGKSAALISDAGTPLMADPGYTLVRALRKRDLPVFAVPGPFAAAAALCSSGIAPYPFCFLGFLPRAVSEREKTLSAYGALPASIVFYERKDRLADSLRAAYKVLGPRDLGLARELTKEHEEFMLLRLENFTEPPGSLLGEFTVIIGPPESARRSAAEEIVKLIAHERIQGGPPKEIARRVCERCCGWTAKEIYALILQTR